MSLHSSKNVLNHPIISERYFFPRPGRPPQPFWVESADARLACVYDNSHPHAPTIVHFHGNGEIVSDYVDGFLSRIRAMGCNCFLVEYRGYGGSTGKPELGKMLEDVIQVITTLSAYTKHVFLYGRSVGSLFAIKAAQIHPQVQGLILESAISDLLERILMRTTPYELGITFEQLKKAVHSAVDIEGILKSFSKPVLILHALHDGLVDVSHAEQLAKWCAGAVFKNIFTHGNHNDIMFVNQEEYFKEIQKFITLNWSGHVV